MKKLTFLLILLIILSGVLFFIDDLLNLYLGLSLKLSPIEKKATVLVEEIKKQVTALPALKTEKEVPESNLTRAGIIEWTNVQREKNGLPLFKESLELNFSALLKAEDMFDKNYFSHFSPSGEGVSELVEIANYEFIAIGENLALGGFENDQILLQGWMESPGHRENILNPQYQEIGVAAVQGEFDGRTTWIAVQHFGLPLNACSQPSQALLEEIETNENELKMIEEELDQLEDEIKKSRPRQRPDYNLKVEKYNSLVSQYNDLLAKTKELINQYNNEVALFNECASGF